MNGEVLRVGGRSLDSVALTVRQRLSTKGVAVQPASAISSR